MEYDGARQVESAQPESDRGRVDPMLGTDWLVLHVTAQRLRDDFEGIVAEIRAAMRSRKVRS